VKVLVTGAGGLLGGEVVRVARERSWEVLAMDRAALDVTDSEAVRTALEGAQPRAVIHCAAYTAVDRAESEPEVAHAVNAEGAGHVARAASAVGAHVAYVSTDYVFDGTGDRPYLPGDPTGPLSVYGRTKLAGEAAVRDASIDALVVRTSWLYGDGRGFVPAILRLAESGEPLRVVSDQRGRPTHAHQAAVGILDLLVYGARGIWHVAGGGECTWYELATAALELRGVDADVERVTGAEFGAAAPRPAYSVLDLAATEAMLGRRMADWRHVLATFLNEEGQDDHDSAHAAPGRGSDSSEGRT